MAKAVGTGALSLALLSVLAACSPVQLDPTELTRGIHIENRLSAPILLQVCTTAHCSEHLRADRVGSGQEDDVNVQATARNPFRVLAASDRRILGCFVVGPKIAEDERVPLTRTKLTRCDRVRGG